MAVNEATHNSSLSVGGIVFFVVPTPRFLPLTSITTYIQIRSTYFKTTDVIKCTEEPFYYQLIHIMLKNTELLKHSKITLQHVSVYVETIFRELQSVLG